MKSRLRRYLFPASVLLLYAIWALLLGSVFRRGETPIVNRFIGYCVSGLLLGLMPAVQAAMDGRFEFKIAPLPLCIGIAALIVAFVIRTSAIDAADSVSYASLAEIMSLCAGCMLGFSMYLEDGSVKLTAILAFLLAALCLTFFIIISASTDIIKPGIKMRLPFTFMATCAFVVGLFLPLKRDKFNRIAVLCAFAIITFAIVVFFITYYGVMRSWFTSLCRNILTGTAGFDTSLAFGIIAGSDGMLLRYCLKAPVNPAHST